MSNVAEFDTGPLTWVKGEIDQALARSLAALRAYASNPSESAQLRYCQTHFHQAHGALQIVGLDGVTKFSEELEGLIGDLAKGIRPEPVAAAERGIATISTYLEQLLAGEPNQPLKLFAVYREVVLERGRPEPDPVDLYFPPLTGRAPQRMQEPHPIDAGEQALRLREAQGRFQRGLLRWLRKDPIGMRDMADAVGTLEASEPVPALRAFWWAVHALTQAVAGDEVDEPDGFARLANRIERQMTRLAHESGTVAERLLREVLFAVARARPNTASLREVQHVFGLVGSVPEQFELATENIAQLPRLRAMREVVQNAKTAWTRYAAGHTPTVASFCEYAVMLRDRSASLGRWDLSRMAEEMVTIADELTTDAGPTDEALALEVATGLLLFEDAVDKFNTLPTDFARQCQAIIERLRHYRGEHGGASPPNLTDGSSNSPILEDITRRAQEKMAITQLVAEIQNNLRAIESGLDAYFRDPDVRESLATIDKPLVEVLGGFRILSEHRSVDVLEEVAVLIRRFGEAGYMPRQSDFEYVAGVLSGLGFYADALQHGHADFDSAMQPIRNRREAMARDEADFSPPTVSLETQLTNQQRDIARVLAAWRAMPEDDAKRGELRAGISAIQRDAGLVADAELEARAVRALQLLERAELSAESAELAQAVGALHPPALPSAAPSREVEALAESSREVIDAELLDIYLQEATEVLTTIHEHLERARRAPGTPDVLVPIRRGFHTLKGSGRMVGLPRPADAAWAVERLLNEWLEAEHPPTEGLLGVVRAAERYFSDAVIRLKEDRPLPDETGLIAMASGVRMDESPVVIGERRVSAALFNIFLDEARTHIATMHAGAAALVENGSVSDDYPHAAHTLAGIAGTVHLSALRELCLAIEQALDHVTVPVAELDRAVFAHAQDAMRVVMQSVHERSTPQRPSTVIAQLGDIINPPQPIVALSVPQPDPGPTEDQPVPPAPVSADIVPIIAVAAVAAITAPVAALTVVDVPVAEVATNAQSTVAPPTIEPLTIEPPTIEPLTIEPPTIAQSTAEPPTLFELRAMELPAALPAAPSLPSVPSMPSAPPAPSMPTYAAPPFTPPARIATVHDDLDLQLLPVFVEEGQELLPAIGAALRDWRDHSTNPAGGHALQRALHTLKGSARMVGAMTLGQRLHGMEARVDHALASPGLPANLFDELESEYDRVGTLFDALSAPTALTARAGAMVPPGGAIDGVNAVADAAGAATTAKPDAADDAVAGADTERVAMLRVKADMVDRLVTKAGEVAISRSRIEGEMRVLKAAMSELNENVSRLRSQLREIEIQAETQIQSRLIHAKDDLPFDPLEFDRFTRFQELTRLMAESVNDVATVQSNISRSIDETDTALSSQARVSRDLQQDLLRVRMMPFSSLAERLYRIVRQGARDSAKRAVLDIRNGQIELDRSVLERITAPFEHMLRNAVAHGLEAPADRRAQGKSEVGELVVEVEQEGNEVRITVSDDGAGLDFDRIRSRAREVHLLRGDEQRADAELAELIFRPGFSTATVVTELAGRGVGMDVVKSEIAAVGGRIEVASVKGRGTTFKITLPLTLAVTQAVLVSAGGAKYVIPAVMVEQVRQIKRDEMREMYDSRQALWQGRRSEFRYLPHLLGDARSEGLIEQVNSVVFVRSGTNSVAVHIDEMLGNQEIVVKTMGPLLARVTGITGATVLSTGEVVLILNPVLLAQRGVAGDAGPIMPPAPRVELAKPEQSTVMIVDDSLTVRKITGRLLQREGYSVLTARDGVEALEQLSDIVPDVLLVDIEMPRMDGFDLTRNVRADARLKDIPIIMITSRTAEKHRKFAQEIGVNVYLGKPYRDDELIGHVARFIAERRAQPQIIQ